MQASFNLSVLKFNINNKFLKSKDKFMAVAIPPKVSKTVDVVVSIGAAVVIWGALRKFFTRLMPISGLGSV